jgi:predicted negative regulator of RcsB-dependent stress response
VSSHDEEQLEQLKRFWQEYGSPILVGVILALAVFLGWRYWQNTQLEAATKGAAVFQDMLGAAQRSALNEQDKTASTDLQRYAKTIREDYAKTPFANSAGLLLARHAVEKGDYKEAEKQLQLVLDAKPSESERVLVVTRLARVQAEQKKYEEALALLNKESDKGFAPTIEEIKGDIFAAQGKTAEAQKAYLAAISVLDARDENRPLLEIKLADVGLAVPPTSKKAD